MCGVLMLLYRRGCGVGMLRLCVVPPFNYNNVCSILYVHYHVTKTGQSLSTTGVSARTCMALLKYMFIHVYVTTYVNLTMCAY